MNVKEIDVLMGEDHDANVAGHAVAKQPKPRPAARAAKASSQQAQDKPAKKQQQRTKPQAQTSTSQVWSSGQAAALEAALAPLRGRTNPAPALSTEDADKLKADAASMLALNADLTGRIESLEAGLKAANAKVEAAEAEAKKAKDWASKATVAADLAKVDAGKATANANLALEGLNAFRSTVARVESFMGSMTPRRMTGDDLARGIARFIGAQA